MSRLRRLAAQKSVEGEQSLVLVEGVVRVHWIDILGWMVEAGAVGREGGVRTRDSAEEDGCGDELEGARAHLG